MEKVLELEVNPEQFNAIANGNLNFVISNLENVKPRDCLNIFPKEKQRHGVGYCIDAMLHDPKILKPGFQVLAKNWYFICLDYIPRVGEIIKCPYSNGFLGVEAVFPIVNLKVTYVISYEDTPEALWGGCSIASYQISEVEIAYP